WGLAVLLLRGLQAYPSLNGFGVHQELVDVFAFVERPEAFRGHPFPDLKPEGRVIKGRLRCRPRDGAQDMARIPQLAAERVRPKVAVVGHMKLVVKPCVPGAPALVSQQRAGADRVPFVIIAVHFQHDLAVAGVPILKESKGPRREALELPATYSNHPGRGAGRRQLLTGLAAARGRVELLQLVTHEGGLKAVSFRCALAKHEADELVAGVNGEDLPPIFERIETLYRGLFEEEVAQAGAAFVVVDGRRHDESHPAPIPHDLPGALDKELEGVRIASGELAGHSPVLKAIIAALLEVGRDGFDPLCVGLVRLAQAGMLCLQFADSPVQFPSYERSYQHVIATVEFLAVGLYLIPRRVAQDHVETGVVTVEEDFGEFQLPVEEPFPFPDLLEVRPPGAPLGVS